jgi:hypothetical protein
MARLLRFVVIGVVALVALPTYAFAGALTLHPSGFGTKSYSSWKAHQGQPDSNGNSEQALYFQKDVPTATVAAGVAVVRGLEGQAPSALMGLSWEHRVDGHCGAGAPRWNVYVRDSAGTIYTVFLGCAAATHSPGSAPNWIRDSYDNTAIQAQIGLQTPGAVGALTIAGLAILYDDGNDVGAPCPDVGNSCVYLDNIIVNNHCWTSAGDNGSNAPSAAECTPAEFAGLGIPTLVTPADSGLLTALGVMFPSVPPLDWTFYNNVL